MITRYGGIQEQECKVGKKVGGGYRRTGVGRTVSLLDVFAEVDAEGIMEANHDEIENEPTDNCSII